MAKHPVEQAPRLDFTASDFNEMFAYLSNGRCAGTLPALESAKMAGST